MTTQDFTVLNTEQYTVLAQARLSQGKATAPCSVCVVRWRSGNQELSVHTFNHETGHMGGDGFYCQDTPRGIAGTFAEFSERVNKDAEQYLYRGTPLTGDPQ